LADDDGGGGGIGMGMFWAPGGIGLAGLLPVVSHPAEPTPGGVLGFGWSVTSCGDSSPSPLAPASPSSASSPSLSFF
jgi:hypothetical protein